MTVDAGRPAPTRTRPAPASPPAGVRSRAWAALAPAWLLIAAAVPGTVFPAGEPLLALVGLALWARAASAAPARRTVLAEAVTGGLGWAWIYAWSGHVHPFNVVWMAVGMAGYVALAGAVLRRLRDVPLALAAPAAWGGVEALRSIAPPPLGMPWMRLGTLLHEHLWLAGSARVAGTWGLSWVLLAAAGLLADASRRRASRAAIAAGLAPLALAAALAALTSPPPLDDGPTVLLVQPGLEQERKMRGASRSEVMLDSLRLTQLGLHELRAAGAPEPDLVAWGETMFRVSVVDPDVLPALERGDARNDPWVPAPWTPEIVRAETRLEQDYLDRVLFGGARSSSVGLLPEGTSFVTGAEHVLVRDGRLRRRNAVVLWRAGERGRPRAERLVDAVVGKVHLVPSAETMLGLERFRFVREIIFGLAGYVPDLLAFDEPGALSFETRAGRELRFGASVCYDNAFDDVFTDVSRRGGVDFHMVFSNEAWFVTSSEFDQMVAFSRLAAIQTARSVVRATNSGVTLAFDPAGRELARLRVDGSDRAVRGTLAVRVPVPAEGHRAARTPFVAWERAWIAAALAAPALVGLFVRLRTHRRRAGNRPEPAS